MLGSVGLGLCYITYENEHMNQLKNWARCFYYLSREISFAKLPLSEACFMVSGKVQDEMKFFLQDVYENTKFNQGLIFKDVWKKELYKRLKGSTISKEEQALLMNMPNTIGYADIETQAQELLHIKEELEEKARKLGEEFESKKKVAISLGVFGGMLLIIILL